MIIRGRRKSVKPLTKCKSVKPLTKSKYKDGDIVLFKVFYLGQSIDYEIGLIGQVKWDGVTGWQEHYNTGAIVGTKYETYRAWWKISQNSQCVHRITLKNNHIIMILDQVEDPVKADLAWDEANERRKEILDKAAESWEN